ncbi:ribosome biogenesis GTPase YlqF, partial [[Clostridium] symbiosum]|nr:ribosome biogenesis GTPase YlqF [[Clostridium] symbiosum]
MKLLDILAAQYPEALASRYKLDPEALAACTDGFAVLQLIGRKRGMLVSGGEIDTERASIMLVDEY